MQSSSKTPPSSSSSGTFPPDEDTEAVAGAPTEVFAGEDDEGWDREDTETSPVESTAESTAGTIVPEFEATEQPQGNLAVVAVAAFAAGFGIVMMSVFQGQFLISAYHHGGL